MNVLDLLELSEEIDRLHNVYLHNPSEVTKKAMAELQEELNKMLEKIQKNKALI